MAWNNRLYAPAGDGDGAGGDAEDKGKDKNNENKVSKIKVGDREYDEENARSALSLYEALQDPETGTEIIETLARRAGLLAKDGKVERKEGETKKEAESRATRILKAKLGKDYDKFAESVGPAFDEIISEFLEERLGHVRAESTQTSWNKAVDKFTDSHELTSEIEDKMKELINEAPPNLNRADFNADKYLSRIYRNAVSELQEASKKSSRRGSSRVKDDDDELPEFVVREAPKNVSIDDAVEAAMNGIRFKRR